MNELKEIKKMQSQLADWWKELYGEDINQEAEKVVNEIENLKP